MSLFSHRQGWFRTDMNKKGFTLIEVIMIIVILGIMLPGIMMYFIQGVKNSADSQRRTTAIFLAEGLMEEIRSKCWDENNTATPNCSTIITNCATGASATLGSNGETRVGFDDIDDFNGLDRTPPYDSQNQSMNSYPGFRQQVTIIYVNPATLDTDAGGPTCYKRIEVKITDTGTNNTVSLVSLMTNY